MPFPMKIQPIDLDSVEERTLYESVKPVAKSRLKRLFERQFTGVVRIPSTEKIIGIEQAHCKKDSSGEFDPSSICLANMVQNFIEDNDKQSAMVRCRNRSSCFNGNCSDSSEEELDSFGDACEILKVLVPCASIYEINLLTDTSKIVEKNKISKRKDDNCRKIVIDGLLALGYDASTCKSKWKKSPSYPAGEYTYVDVMVEGERFIVDIDFRSEFEIARSTKSYKAILQILPAIFVGSTDRLRRIIAIVSEAAKQSLKKKGMHFPPWRNAEYVNAKWLSPSTRTTPTLNNTSLTSDLKKEKKKPLISTKIYLVEEGVSPVGDDCEDTQFPSGEEAVKKWEPPEIKPKNSRTVIKIVTGLASIMEVSP